MDYKNAKEKVKALKGFYIHLAIYLSVMGFLFTVDYLTGSGWWFYYPAIFWGVAIVINGVVLLFEDGLFGSDWEERKINELMGKGIS